MSTMKTNIELHDILRNKITKELRGFSLAFLKFLRTNKAYGHTAYANNLGIYVALYNEMFGQTYDHAQMLSNEMSEAHRVIDAENQQESFDFDAN